MARNRSVKEMLRGTTVKASVPALSAAVKATEAILDTIKEAPKRPKAETVVVSPTNDQFDGKYDDGVETTTIGGKKGRRVRVKIAALHLDDSYQFRPETEPGRIKQLEAWLKERNGFDPHEAGPVHLNMRKGGSLWIIDGGGRTWMAQRANLDMIDAIIYEGLTWDEEKAFFLRKNRDKRTIRAPHLFAVTASSGVEPHATIYRIVNAVGFGLERVGGDGRRSLFAPSALLWAYYLDGTGDILEMSLYDIKKVFGTSGKGVEGRLLVTIAALRFCGAGKDQERLRHVLSHDPSDHDADCNLDRTFQLARTLASPHITSRSIQSRDLNPFLFILLCTRFNYRLARENGKSRINPNDIKLALDRLSTGDAAERWGNKTLYKDVWSWGQFGGASLTVVPAAA